MSCIQLAEVIAGIVHEVRGGFSWLKEGLLEQVVQDFTQDQQNALNAVTDIRVCMRVLLSLRRRRRGGGGGGGGGPGPGPGRAAGGKSQSGASGGGGSRGLALGCHGCRSRVARSLLVSQWL